MENYIDHEAGFTLPNLCQLDPSLISASHLCNLYSDSDWHLFHLF